MPQPPHLAARPDPADRVAVSRFKIWERAADRVLPASQRSVKTVLPWKQLGGTTRADLGAVYTYLRSTKPVIHRVCKRDPMSAR